MLSRTQINIGEGGNCEEVVGILLQNLLEALNSSGGERLVLRCFNTRHEAARITMGEIQFSVDRSGIYLECLFKISGGGFIPRFTESANTLAQNFLRL